MSTQELILMKDKISGLVEKTNLLEVRERVIICVAVLVVLVGAFDQFWMSPYSAQISELKEEYRGLHRANQDNSNRLLILDTQISIDPNEKVNTQIRLAQRDEKKLDKVLLMSSAGLISPERMLPVLSEILGNESGLRLISMTNVASEPVESGDKSMKLALFKHGLELNFIGSFNNVKKYIKKLEMINEKIYLDEVNYQLTNYPLGELKLKVHTLSVYEALING